MSTKGKLCMRKILVTGAGGFVGARILDQWRGRYELCTFPHGFSADSDEAAVRALIAREKPDVIVHTAALSNTAYCARHPEESLRANVLLPEWIAKAAAETGAKLLAFSSDQVYAGCKRSGTLSETLSLAPANVYGCHKLEAEQRVLAINPGSILLRAAWMYDFPGYRLPIRGNLPLNLLNAAKTGTALHFSEHDFRGVSYVREVIDKLIPAMELPGGVYNFGSGNDCDMFETVSRFAQFLGVEVPLEKDHWERNLAMSGEKLKDFGIQFDSTIQAFQQCLDDYGFGHF